MVRVQIEKPGNVTPTDWFAELNRWFDEKKCQPLSFHRSGRIMDRLLYDAVFMENGEARLFASRFRSCAPSFRRLRLYEPRATG
jgi:hypothetical protein